MASSKMCESCIHHKVCYHDKNLVGDTFVPGNPMFFDNKELYKKYKEWEAKGFPCEDYLKADAVEVKHGRWVEVKSWESEKHSVTDMRCNLCGKFASLVLPHKTKCTYKYCPNCGARMDGESDE